MKTKRAIKRTYLQKFALGGVLFSVAVCLLLMTAQPASALSCDAPSIERSYKKSDWVFLAEVLEAQNTYSEKDPRDRKSLQKLKLKVLQIWKGSPPETMKLEILTSKTVLITARPDSLETHQSYIFALTGEQTTAPYSFRVVCDSPWPASASEKEILWLNNTKG